MDNFLKTVTHPNKKILARKIISGIPPGELYAEYGKTRVMEMQKEIEAFSNLKVESRMRAIPDAGCRMCRRKPSTCLINN